MAKSIDLPALVACAQSYRAKFAVFHAVESIVVLMNLAGARAKKTTTKSERSAVSTP